MGRNLDLSRRGFIGAAGSAAAFGAMALAGCGSQRASEVGSAEGGSAGAATLTYGVRTESLGLDLGYTFGLIAWALMVAAVVLTVVSGVQYFWNARHVVFGR